ncbi:uncharacterized protein LOC132758280 [Ruditapes philippinarum]|uniref:uncharacterized protein LOC132758280 n=1 Tax=Ruditapes philippinarum TaxID=129788 RepID=UPI00295A959A|nr:uncharacterized protein LOC132758280 [Ruditapes philippinarum]
MNIGGICIIIALLAINITLSKSCSWPTAFRNTIWHDSNRGEVTFTDTTLSGWGATAQGGTTIDSWECYSVNETSSTTLTLLLKATTTFELWRMHYVAYACLQMEEFSEQGYRYYQMSEEDQRMSYDRLPVSESSTYLINPPTENRLCLSSDDTNAPSTEEYHVIIRNGTFYYLKGYFMTIQRSTQPF